MLQGTGTSVTSSTAGPTPLISVEDLTIQFGGIRAVDGVTIDLANGCCGIIGPNGAGKTTLLDCLAGVRPPTTGRVRLGGNDVTERSSVWRARHGVRRTFQRGQAFGWLTVEENLLVAAEWRGRGARILSDMLGLPGSKRRRGVHQERIDEVLQLCGLEDVRDKSAATLPIGQLRLMEFGRAIIDRPRLLLLDEPTSGLGVEPAGRLGAAIMELTSSGTCAAILVEHDLEFVTRTCDRLVVLEFGRVIADGDPLEVCRDPAVVSAYIGVR
jgi:branched-chain amino acid transport system ATP-binding protein